MLGASSSLTPECGAKPYETVTLGHALLHSSVALGHVSLSRRWQALWIKLKRQELGVACGVGCAATVPEDHALQHGSIKQRLGV